MNKTLEKDRLSVKYPDMRKLYFVFAAKIKTGMFSFTC